MDAPPAITFKVPRTLSAVGLGVPGFTHFVLQVPLSELEELVLRPVRWMLLVAWGLLHCQGRVQDDADVVLQLDEPMDALRFGAVYEFVPIDVGWQTNAPHSPHYSPSGSKHGTSESSRSTDSSRAFPDRDRDEILNERDGDLCVFSGRRCTARSHVLPHRFSRNSAALTELARERGFGFEHHMDPKNALTLQDGLHKERDKHHAFVLATDDRFLRSVDVPPPDGAVPPPWSDTSTGQTYIYQPLALYFTPTHPTYGMVQKNARARFANPSSDCLPSVEALHYVYAAEMVDRWLQRDADVLKVIWRAAPLMPPPSPDPDESECPLKRACGDGHGRLYSSGPRAGQGGSRPDTRSQTGNKLSPLEFMVLLTRNPVFLEKQDEEEEEQEKRRSLEDWVSSSSTPAFGVPQT